MASFYNTFHSAAVANPEEPAILYEDSVLTYAQLDALVQRISGGLTELGMAAGDRLMFYSPNRPEYLATYLACAHAGNVFAPANVGFRARELNYICANAEADIAVVHSSVLDDFKRYTAKASHRPGTIIVLEREEGSATTEDEFDFAEVAAAAPAESPATVDSDHPMLICYTSGTTSTPKPVLHSHASEIYNATVYAEVWHFKPGDRGVVSMPLAWVYGLSTSSMAMFAGGAAVVLMSRFNPVELLTRAEQQHATILFGTMAMYTKMLEVMVSSGKSYDFAAVRLCVNGGEACSDGAVGAFEAHTGLKLLQAYALSEARPVLAVDPEDADAPRNVSGKPVRGAEIRIVNEEGKRPAEGERGEAQVRSGGMMTEYYREPEITAEKLTEDGWLRTGDLLAADSKGYYSVVGRATEMIIRSGANIAPAEVESALISLDGVAAAAAVGVPDENSGEAVIGLIVAPTGTVDEADLIAQLSEDLASYKVPQRIFTVDELPSNMSGKSDRVALVRLAVERLAAEPTVST